MTMQEQLNQYYKDVGIAPVSGSSYPEMFKAFKCEDKKDDCLKACLEAYEKNFSTKEGFRFAPRTEGVTISQYYQNRQYKGDHIPRIVVVSLSVPRPWEERDNKPAANPKTPWQGFHWRETLAMVRSLLHPFIASENFPEPATYSEAESRWEIEELFVHVRTAKCCSNANRGSEEPSKVYANCGGYLGKELSILEPDVIVTQGNKAHGEAEKHAFGAMEKEDGLGLKHPFGYIVKTKEGNRRVYWLRSYFPTKRTLKKFFYPQAGPEIESERNVVGAMREHFVRYGEAIKEFINDR